jgi:hypothetical protein
LVFVLHDVSWVYGSNWCIGLWDDEELQIFEGWQLCNGKVFLLVSGKDRKKAKYSNVGYVYVRR